MVNIAYFDIDGVLANDGHRVHFALDRDWANYFDPKRMAADLVWEEGRELAQQYAADGWDVRYLTGRRIDRYLVTHDWLINQGFPWQGEIASVSDDAAMPRLRMRSFSEIKRLAEHKTEILRRVIATEHPERLVLFEDDPEVVKLVQETFGPDFARLTPWYVKEKAMVRKATA